MAFGSLLLRVLLVIALLANATAGAATLPATSGMRMHHDAVVERGCHEHASMHRGDTALSVAAKEHSGKPGSCCSTGHCRCDGVPPLPGVVDAGNPHALFVRTSYEAPVARLARTDPALPHLIRPPIGEAVLQRL